MKIKHSRKAAVLTGAAALLALTSNTHAQSADALIDKLVQKGILTAGEAKDLQEEADNNFRTAFATKTGMPDWVTGYKLSGDFRGRFEQFSGDNAALIDRTRLRYRVRLGIAVSMFDNLEAGLRLGSGDAKGVGSQSATGNPVSNNTTFQDNATKKFIYVDAAYGRWTALNSGGWVLAATVGKMDNPFVFTPMVFDPDLTPEGAALSGSYLINDKHSLGFAGGAFVLDEETGSTHDPFFYGGQVLWTAKWSPKWTSVLGVGGFQIASTEQLTTANVPYVNQGNSRTGGGALINNYNPIIADASVTYALSSFPFYTGAFPIKVAGEFLNNPGAGHDNSGYWVGVTFGKSGTKRTWDLTYRYEYLEADAWYDQFVDDDSGAFYQNAPTGGTAGYFGGTNVKGHMVKLNYSFTDALTFSATCFINDLINSPVQNGVAEPNNGAIHFYADLMWKF